MQDFLTLYPGIYLPEEQAALAEIQSAIRAGLKRANMRFDELVASSDGRDRGLSYRITARPDEVQARMKALDPDNPIWFEGKEGSLPVPETWSCPKGGYFGGMNRSFGDLTCVKEHHHYCRFIRPVYQGDTLYPVLVDQQVWDATPYEGSKWRTWALRGTGYVYNQHGELVVIQTCGAEECFQIYADPEKRTWHAENTGVVEPEMCIRDRNYLLSLDGVIVGWLKLNGFCGNDLWVSMLVIQSEYRGCQLGRQALDFAEATARQNGFHRLNVQTTVDNLTAVALYLKYGFDLIAYVDQDQRYIFQKELG